jgi:hypothetical protein
MPSLSMVPMGVSPPCAAFQSLTSPLLSCTWMCIPRPWRSATSCAAHQSGNPVLQNGCRQEYLAVAKPFYAAGIGRMRGNYGVYEWHAGEDFFLDTNALVNIQLDVLFLAIFGRSTICRGEADSNQTNNSPNTGFMRCLPYLVREKVHVVETGDSPSKHFCDSEPRAIRHEFRRNKFSLGRPNMILKPRHQREIIRDSP